jgi:TrmH family RNA methyltransferase
VSRTLVISSPTNQTIKELVRLKDRKGERAERSFVVEGRREIERAIKSGFVLEDLFYCPDVLDKRARDIVDRAGEARLAEVSAEAFAKVATREGADGLIAVFETRVRSFQDIERKAGQNHIFLVALEDIEKPGNLGAVLRTADGAGVHGVIALGQTVDIWNPNVIRSSLGGVFSVPVVNAKSSEFFDWCAQRQVRVVAAALTAHAESLFKKDLQGPLAIVLGSEADGLSQTSLSRADEVAIAPMSGLCDSLNISVAAGVFIYEAVRQRNS